MRNLFARVLILTLLLVSAVRPGPAVELLDEDFDLPDGFHIYRYYDHREEFETAYSVAFDTKGRLHIGTGDKILRVLDTDGDGVADKEEDFARGFQHRGPQGLLFLEDRVFANGIDSTWILEDLDEDGIPRFRRQIGGPLETGGDHGAHGFIRGIDGYVYWMAGNDSRFTPERHITEKNSPIRDPLGATIFRISPDGDRWEAVSTGCRNPFDVAMNHLGELMTVDSDHEGQIGLPYYRPVRFTHYVTGGRMGWLSWGDGKTEPYQIDNLPGLFDVGRGSPTGVLFYEHNQFPEKYRDMLLMGDYQNKRGENLLYATTGSILAFDLKRNGATWDVTSEVMVRPKQETGASLTFAVIDMEVAPDGSIMLTTRSDGVLRLYYDPEGDDPLPLEEIAGAPTEVSPLDQIFDYPQPGVSWAQAPLNALAAEADLEAAVLDKDLSVRKRLRALRLLSPQFESLDYQFLRRLVKDNAAEIRAQGAWLLGLRAKPAEQKLVTRLFDDEDNLVRRRAAEALARLDDSEPFEPFMPLLASGDRSVRFAGMHGLSHRDPKVWLESLEGRVNFRVRLAGLTALTWTDEGATPTERTREIVNNILGSAWDGIERAETGGAIVGATPRLELLRVSYLWRSHLTEEVRDFVEANLIPGLENADLRVLKEAARLAGRLKCGTAVVTLASRLPDLPDPVLQLFVLDQLASIENGWTPEIERAVIQWLDASDEGWHGDRRGKGTSYHGWWGRIVQTFVDDHWEAIRGGVESFHLTGPFGAAVLAKLDKEGAPDGIDLEQLADLRKTRIATRKRDLIDLSGRSLKTNEEIREFALSSAVEAGVPSLGRDVFNYLCATCHTEGAAGTRRGPDLKDVRSGTPEYLIDSILQPNAKVAEEYRSRYIDLIDGEIVTGTLLEETSGTITVAGEGDPVKIRRSDIDRITISENSAMPEEVLNALTWNEIRDLWAYLRSAEE